jgi:hypothetical protein
VSGLKAHRKALRFGSSGGLSLRLTKYGYLACIILLLTISLFAVSVQAQQVPVAVYNRYVTLAGGLEIISEKTQNKAQNKIQEQVSLLADIQAFYRQQITHSVERQLLAANLQLQALLMQQHYAEGYAVVSHLLTLPLSVKQQLSFQQLAGQLATGQLAATQQQGNKAIHSEADEGKLWATTAQHLTAWFTLVNSLDDKQLTEYHITTRQQAANAALLAQAYYLQAQLNRALPAAQLAYKLVPKNESYLQLLLALLQRLELHQLLNKQLAVAVVDFPRSKDYWERLAYSYLQLGNEQSALSTLAVARNQGLLTAQGYRVLASLYLTLQQPRLAATVYLEGSERSVIKQDTAYYKGLTDAWLMARERGLALLVLQQAEVAGIVLAKSGQQQAQLLYLEGRWSDAEKAYFKLLDINKSATVKETDKWRFMLAMSQFELAKKAEAQANLLLLQSEQYQGYAKEWLAQ